MGAYRHWLDTPVAMATFREMYRIPDVVETRLDDPEDVFDGMSFRDGWMPFPLVAIIEGGVRFPVHPLLRACLEAWNLTPCQLMPNAFKIIMGAVALNHILGINLGVHDIEDAYDLCKSKGSSNCYYLRGKPGREQFVTDLEDSSRHAGDDRLFVSGEWELGTDETALERSSRIPRKLGVPPSNLPTSYVHSCSLFYRSDTSLFTFAEVDERRRRAITSGWRKNPTWSRAVRDYKGHNCRAAWDLLGYTPRYKTYIRRGEGAEERSEAELRRSSGAETSTPRSDSEPVRLEQIVEEYHSSSSPEGEMQPKPALQTKNLGAKFGKGIPSISAPAQPSSTSFASGVAGSSSSARVLEAVRERAADVDRRGDRPEKRHRQEDSHEGDRQRSVKEARKKASSDQEPREKASKEKRSAPGGVTEKESGTQDRTSRGLGEVQVSDPAGPGPWRPTFYLEDGRQMTVEDRLSGNPLVAAAFANACALPLDMQRLQGVDDAALPVSSMQSTFLVIPL